MSALPEPGDAFAGRYRIISELGQGDRKRTCLAEDTLLARQVALALIKPDAAKTDPDGTTREAKTLARAGSHDNIVTLYDQGTANGIEYLVFEYLSGGTLKEFLSRRSDEGQPLTPKELMRLGRQLGRALSQLHSQGLIHRDVAPGNVWFDERQEAHLGDFDSAVRPDSLPDLEFLPPTTESYSAPEQRTGVRLDERTDLFSMGAVLYEASTGELPPRGQRPSVEQRLLELRPDLPRGLASTICWLLEKRPDDRPDRADDVLGALRPPRVPSSDQSALISWTESLPFPLASILWHYHGETNAGTGVETLLNFFEALAQTRATVLLSAAVSDSSFFADKKASIIGSSSGDKHVTLDLRRPTFGTWIELSARLAKRFRILMESDADQCSAMFAGADAQLVESLTGNDLTATLTTALEHRNNLSHGGIDSTRVQQQQVHDLETLLSTIRALLGWSFDTWTLLRPGPMTLSGGIYHLSATDLTGANPMFRKKQAQLTQPLDAERLYLLSDGSAEALRLLPLIRVMAGTKSDQDACYFYNRLQGNAIRWVSYHFSAEPELVLEDDEVSELVAEMSTEPSTR